MDGPKTLILRIIRIDVRRLRGAIAFDHGRQGNPLRSDRRSHHALIKEAIT
jgi:hypothetical protein